MPQSPVGPPFDQFLATAEAVLDCCFTLRWAKSRRRLRFRAWAAPVARIASWLETSIRPVRVWPAALADKIASRSPSRAPPDAWV